MIINPIREKDEPELPPTGLLLPNPMEAKAAIRLAESQNGQKRFLFNSNLAVIPEPKPVFIAGPAVGAPMAVLTLEKLIALGARSIITFGWCGSLSSELEIGDVLLPTWAISDEGTSAHYPLNSRPESHAPTRDTLSKNLTAQGFTVQSGPVWTTDAPYRESFAQVKELRKQNILGADMEYAALIAAAAFRQVEVTTVLLVSDELWRDKWQPGFRTKGFKKKSRDILNFLIEYYLTPEKN